MAAGNVETSQRITDVILAALAKAAPELIPAASSGTMNNLTFGGWDRARGRAFAYYETIAGGMGASAVSDGASATHTHMTNSWNTPVEAFEHLYPLRIRGYRIRSGSGGAGKHRGGDGIIREYEFLTRADVTILVGSPRARSLRTVWRQTGRARQKLAATGKAHDRDPRQSALRSGTWRCAAHRIAWRRRIRQARLRMQQTWRRLTFLHWRLCSRRDPPAYSSGLAGYFNESAAWVGLVPFEIYEYAWHPVLSRNKSAHLCRWTRWQPRSLVLLAGSVSAGRGIGRARGYHLPYFWARMRVSAENGVDSLPEPPPLAARV